MPKRNHKCSACGAPLELRVAEVFAEAEVIGALCPACRNRRSRASGGCVLTLREELEGARFALGKISVVCGHEVAGTTGRQLGGRTATACLPGILSPQTPSASREGSLRRKNASPGPSRPLENRVP